MSNIPSPFSAVFDLGAVPERGTERVLSPSQAEREAIARWLEVEAVESLAATVHISRKGEDSYLYAARFEARIVQACVITLDPVPAQLSGEFQRSYRVRPKVSARRRKPVVDAPASTAIDLSVMDEDGPEVLDGPLLDLAAPVLEELSLALDPYPKAPGAALELPEEEEASAESPFAVLEKLKKAEPERSGTEKGKGALEPRDSAKDKKGG